MSPDVRRAADQNDDPTQTPVAGVSAVGLHGLRDGVHDARLVGGAALEEHPRAPGASPRTRRSVLVAAAAAFHAVAVRSVGAAAPAAAAGGSTVKAGRPAAATAVTTVR